MDKLLSLLEENARFTNEQLAVMTGMSVEDVERKIEEYEKKGIIKGYKNLNQLAASDERVTALSRKLLDYEQANIRQMQGFL